VIKWNNKTKIDLWLSFIKNDEFLFFSSAEESIMHLSINQNGIEKYNIHTFVDTFSKFNELFFITYKNTVNSFIV